MVFTHSGRTAEQCVVIAGAGRVGHRTAQVLDDYGHEVYLIERDPETVDQVTGRRTGVVIEGDATNPEILRQAEPERADILAALTGDGMTNFAICAEIQHLTDDIQTVARVDEAEQADTAQEFVDEIIYPERAGSKAAINRIQGNDIRTLEDVTGDLDVLNVRVGPQSPVAGKQLKEILLPDGSQVISDADGTEIARPETTLEPDRRYLVAAEPSVADDVHKLLIG
jgi:trk system potassium uptake protein TrkA